MKILISINKIVTMIYLSKSESILPQLFPGFSLIVSNNGLHCLDFPAVVHLQSSPPSAASHGGRLPDFAADFAAAVSLLAMEAKSARETSG